MTGANAAPGARIAEAAHAVRNRLQSVPEVAIVLGSGLGPLAERLTEPRRIPYAEIPHFPRTTVAGHQGELVAGALGGRPVLLQSGRFHLYEGHAPDTVALPVRVFAELGVTTLLLTNAAGGIRRSFARGALMLIADHVNLTFRNPLIGPNLPGEERFPDMSDPYDRELRALARRVAVERKVALEEGVYIQVLGPSYETPAEIRMAERMGADAIGMSTAVEVIVARARGLRCLAFSAISNPAAGTTHERLSHADVLATTRAVAGSLERLVEGVVTSL
ncbi:MAG TPA: purine-nucleoside phosphorylase [Gemmatimonadales bacterium]|nr:purine-nucleoside phosphorylase [Gemmatimonadales bacterium]